MKSATLAFLALVSVVANAQRGVPATSDTLTAQVAPYPGPSGRVLKGSTRDLALLDIRTLTIRSAIMLSGKPDSADQLLIVREGDLNLTIQGPDNSATAGADSAIAMGPGSVALIPAGISYHLEADRSTYYRLRLMSRREENPTASNKMPFILTWPNMPVRHTAKGETRQILSQATPWLSRIDLHATTLNPGEVSHPPHTHRAEEIILLRKGHVLEYINGKHFSAADGDLIFLPSGSLHAVENHSTERAEYFALQWQL